jgi:capsular exopolysaccharide synthesis family protein
VDDPPQAPADGRVDYDAEQAPVHTDVVAQLLRIVTILRRRWLVLAATTILSLAAAALIISTAQPQWKATATVVLHMSSAQVLDKVKPVGEDAEGRWRFDDYYNTQISIISSRAVAERALRRLALADDPVFLGIDGIESEEERAAAAANADPVGCMRSMVSIGSIPDSRIVTISGIYPDPETAADIANAVADAYLEYLQEGRSRLGEDAKTNLSNEREQAAEQLEEAERKLEDFKRENAITTISLEDRQNVTTQNIIALSARTKEAAAKRIELQAAYRQAKRLHEKGNLAGATLLPEDDRSLLESLRQRQIEAQREFDKVDLHYGPKDEHHKAAAKRLALVNEKVDKERKDLLESLEARMRAAVEAESQLGKALQEEQKRALALSALERPYTELDREAKTAAEAYSLVARRDVEIGMTNRVETAGVDTLDRATVPGAPIYPRKGLLLGMGLVGGLGLGALIALGIDFRDHRIRGLLDLERALSGFGLPVLGQLPLLPADTRIGVGNVRAQRRQRDLYAHLFPQSLMAERCRGIRTSLAFSSNEDAVKTLMVTSPGVGEGKSSTAMNVAMSFCQAKKRVTLIDADMRRPRVHQVFPLPVEQEGEGLSNLLAKDGPADSIFTPAGEGAPELLSVVRCGEVPHNPAELLDSSVMRRLLATAREQFDLTILDSPPVLPVADPQILARLVDGVIVVVRCGSTTRGELRRAVHQLRQTDTNILGVVLNEVDSRRSQYGYDYNYYYQYAYRTREAGAEKT